MSPVVTKQIDKSLDFSNRDLREETFRDMVLIGADFSNSDCSGCDFSGSDLSFADFEGANLYKAKFEHAVLYVTQFKDCDLTRADFSKSFMYGAKFVGSVNVTYADFSNFQLECLRRRTCFPEEKDRQRFKHVPPLDPTGHPVGSADEPNDQTYRKLYGDRLFSGGHYIEFVSWELYEQHMQRSQIYNRLKRVFKENYVYDEARDYYYQEQHYLRKSWYTQGKSERFSVTKYWHLSLKVLSSRINEFVVGYGERPSLVLTWIMVGIVLFAGIYWSLSSPITSGSALVPTSICGKMGLKAAHINVPFATCLYYSVCTLTTLGCSDIVPLRWCRLFTGIEVGYGVVMIALLTATIARRLVRD